MPIQPIIDLGQLTAPIFAPELKAAASAAHKSGFAFAKLTTVSGGVIHIAAQAAHDPAPVHVFIQGSLTILSSPHHPVASESTPLPPLHPACRCSRLERRDGLLGIHSAQ